MSNGAADAAGDQDAPVVEAGGDVGLAGCSLVSGVCRAVLAASKGATLAELMARLGHSTPAAAMRYQHAAKGRDAQTAAALFALAAGQASESSCGPSAIETGMPSPRRRMDAASGHVADLAEVALTGHGNKFAVNPTVASLA